MASTSTLPSLLIFGPQTGFPSEHCLTGLREDLISSPHLSSLHEAVIGLPKLWERLIESDPDLRHVPGGQYLSDLRRWMEDGGPFPHRHHDAPNIYSLPVTILLQISQYIRYLNQLGNESHSQVLKSVQDAGIQGFCVGFLSAIAVATSDSEVQIAPLASVAIRLAVCIGAYVDKDGIFSQEPQRFSCVAVRWREHNLSEKEEIFATIYSYPEAYISSSNDESSVTITLKNDHVASLSQKLRDRGCRVKTIHVEGRFHSSVHSNAAEKLTKLIQRSEDLRFPDAENIHAPVRSTVDSQIISQGSLARPILENTLLKPADWYNTLKSSIRRLPDTKKTVALAGFGKHVPSSLAHASSLQLLALSDLDPSLSILPFNNPTHGSDNVSKYPAHSIAIVGMAGRFPGADSVDELWDLLLEGKVMAQPAPVERLRLPQTGDYEHTKWWGNFLRDSDAFDHRFFKKSSREAIAWDPQQRILLEVIYQALEAAGYFGPSSTKEPEDYGCYIGACMNNYYDNLSCHPATAYATIGTSRCFISGCMSHYFGWTGPSLTIDTACSSSLVAINTACRAIWSGECSRAVAGGTNVISSPFDYQNLSAAGFLSPTGQCKPFDAAADGYCRGEGVAVVVLKPLSEAIAENDNILGVIVGSAANQNHNFSHVTVPHSGSQVDLYQKVMKLGGIERESVSYVEAHGTGTGVGDPVEVRSIMDAFGGPQRDSILHFGSIKGSIGHTEATAGIAGLIKVLLMMRHGKIPAQASHTTVNSKIPAFDQYQMAIPHSTLPWNPTVRLACINSYGAAGSNSAALIREKPSLCTPPAPVKLSNYPLVITANSPSSISAYSSKLLDYLGGSTEDEAARTVGSLTFNLADRSNHGLSHILATNVTDIEDMKAQLQAAASGTGITTVSAPKPVVLVFGGQESNFVGLSEDVYTSSKLFRRHLHSCNDLLLGKGQKGFFPSIFQSDPIQDLVTLHTALFAVQYASAKAWVDCGLKVDAVVGHSFGQLTALCISGVLSLPDALTLVAGRASLMTTHWGLEAGSMIFLQADRQTVEQLLQSLKSQHNDFYAEIACYNGPKSHVVVGSSQSIDFLERHVANTSSIRVKRLNVTNGFHSQFTEPMLPHLTALARELDWKRPTLHLETCDEIESTTQPDFRIVSEHSRRPVFFQKATERIAKRFSASTWVEVGRGSSVIQLVKGSLVADQGHTFFSPQLTSANAHASITDVAIGMWKAGYATQYWPFHRSQKPEYGYLSLPPYQFEKTRHWLPFTGRGVEQETEPELVKDEEHDILSFVRFTDRSEKEAVFRIDPHADRFHAMLGGHVMGGQTLAPASLYFELVSRAALFLEKDTEATTYVPSVDNLLMKSPIGQDTTKKIVMTLSRLEYASRAWSFSITTQSTVDHRAEPFEQSNGKVYLKRRDDTQAAQDFRRFESLTGYRRYEEIMNHPDAEKMQGNHIYRAFNTVVHYGEAFRGIKQVACVRMEAAGRVVITPSANDPADQRLCDTPMTDSFMQFAGFLVNYFNNPSMEDVLVCMKIEHIEIGGNFNPDAKAWIVYSNMSEGGETDASSDAYVFEAESRKMVMAAFGFRFSKMSQSLLSRMLKSVNKPGTSSGSAEETHVARPVKSSAVTSTTVPTSKSPSKRLELFKVLSDVTDIPIEELKDDSTLDDLGIDSLMATEVLNDIRSVLGLTIDLTSFLFFPSLKELAAHVDEQLGVDSEDDSDSDARYTPRTDSGVGDVDSPELIVAEDARNPSGNEGRPTIISAVGAFQEIKHKYDEIAKTTGALGFWDEAYPHQARLVLAYTVEAFAALGCDLNRLRPGDAIPQVRALDKHKLLVRQFYRVLEDGKLISPTDGGFARTDVPVEPASAESIFQQIIDLFPQHANVNKLVRTVGSQMAACLAGEKDGVQIVFGDKSTKKTLEDMYEFWPLLRTPSLLLGDFLLNAFTNATGSGKFRILEIGAGTGGTTRYIVNRLRNHNIPFEYVFTDISSSLVASAKKQFKGADNMSFELLDIEKPPRPEFHNAFHCVIATNCIHATRDLDVSLKHIRKMIRDDGVLNLIEITQNMFWLDIVVGLFEGWWLFNDGRTHALVDEKHWERRLRNAGFNQVAWTEGSSPESKTVRVIGAFPTQKTVKAALQTVVYKTIREQQIHADVYYPLDGELPTQKLPIALMIHGGSHVIFSRKDIRPAQTRLLLSKGFLPVSLDHRLCPEASLSQGPMVDICDALDWARNKLPHIQLQREGLQIDGSRVVVVGWSSGGQLAMSLAWTAPQRGLRPPEAILAFYCPTDYEDEWWRQPIQPIGAEDRGYEYDVLEAIQDTPITNYGVVGAWEPLSDPRILTDPRCRIVLHINWKAQTLPVIIGGLPSKKKASQSADDRNWNALPQPSVEQIQAVSSRAQIRQGTYQTPTFLIHGTADDLIPWQQSQGTYDALVDRGVPAGLALVKDAPHICDLSSDPESEGWKAALKGYDFISTYVF